MRAQEQAASFCSCVRPVRPLVGASAACLPFRSRWLPPGSTPSKTDRDFGLDWARTTSTNLWRSRARLRRGGKGAFTSAASSATASFEAYRGDEKASGQGDETDDPRLAMPPLGELLRPRWWIGMLEKELQREKEAAESMGSILKKLPRLLDNPRDKRLAAGGLFFLTVAALAEMGIPHYTSQCILAITRTQPWEVLRPSIVALTACSLAFSLLASIRGIIFSALNQRLTYRLRCRLFLRILSQDVAFFDKEPVGELTSRLTSDAQVISRTVSTNLNVALRNGLQVVTGTAYLAVMSPKLLALTGAIVLLMLGITAVYGSYSRVLSRAQQDALASSNQVAEEAFKLNRLVRAFNSEPLEGKRYRECLLHMFALSQRSSFAYGSYLFSQLTLTRLTKIAAIAAGGFLVVTDRMSVDSLTTFVFYVEFVLWAALAVSEQAASFMEAVGASERVLGFLDAQPSKQLGPPAVPAGAVAPPAGLTVADWQGGVALRDVTFEYPGRPGKKALDGVTIEVAPNRMTALVGASGSGKSTVVALLQRLYDPDSGAVELLPGTSGANGHDARNGHGHGNGSGAGPHAGSSTAVDLREVDMRWYRGRVAAVVQDSPLFSAGVSDNIVYGMDEEGAGERADKRTIQERVTRAAQQASADHFIRELPQGYSTHVTDRLLSGGQRQRLSLARALVREPKLLLLDEATASLDATSEAHVQEALDRAMRERQHTVLVIAHRLSTVRNADLIVVMGEGRVVEQGTHVELVARRGVYWGMLKKQQGQASEMLDLSDTTIDNVQTKLSGEIRAQEDASRF